MLLNLNTLLTETKAVFIVLKFKKKGEDQCIIFKICNFLEKEKE